LTLLKATGIETVSDDKMRVPNTELKQNLWEDYRNLLIKPIEHLRANRKRKELQIPVRHNFKGR